MTSAAAISIAMSCSGICVIVCATELIWGQILLTERLLDWSILSTRYGWLYNGWRGLVFTWIARKTYTNSILAVFLLAGILLTCNQVVPKWVLGGSLMIAAIVQAWLNIRMPYGRDGADQMLFINLLCYFGVVVAHTKMLAICCETAIVFQLCLAYFTAGVTKLFGATWRDGSALYNVLSTKCYGHSVGANFCLRNRHVAKAMAWGIILWEIVFPLAVFVPVPFQLALLATGLIFHILNATLMGLNSFLIVFVGTYPLVLTIRYSWGFVWPFM